MGIDIITIIEELEELLKSVSYWKKCQPHKYKDGFEEHIKMLICELKGEDPDFMGDIKNLLKDENGNKLYPIAQHYTDGEGFYCNSELDAMDLYKIQNIIGDGILDLSIDYPIKIMLLTEDQQRESEYNGALYDGHSYKNAFLLANGKELTPEDINEERGHEGYLTFDQVKEKYSHLLKENP